jgi:hypothetical protein
MTPLLAENLEDLSDEWENVKPNYNYNPSYGMYDIWVNRPDLEGKTRTIIAYILESEEDLDIQDVIYDLKLSPKAALECLETIEPHLSYGGKIFLKFIKELKSVRPSQVKQEEVVWFAGRILKSEYKPDKLGKDYNPKEAMKAVRDMCKGSK